MIKSICAFITGGIAMVFYAVPPSEINGWALKAGTTPDVFVILLMIGGFVTATYTVIGE